MDSGDVGSAASTATRQHSKFEAGSYKLAGSAPRAACLVHQTQEMPTPSQQPHRVQSEGATSTENSDLMAKYWIPRPCFQQSVLQFMPALYISQGWAFWMQGLLHQWACPEQGTPVCISEGRCCDAVLPIDPAHSPETRCNPAAAP